MSSRLIPSSDYSIIGLEVSLAGSRYLNLLWAVGALVVVALALWTLSGGGSWRAVRDESGRLSEITRTDHGIELTISCDGHGIMDVRIHQTGAVGLVSVSAVDVPDGVHVGYFSCGPNPYYSCYMRNGGLDDVVMAQDQMTFNYSLQNSDGTPTAVRYDLQRLRPLYQQLRSDCRGHSDMANDIEAELTTRGVTAEVNVAPDRAYGIVRVIAPEGATGMAAAERALSEISFVRNVRPMTAARAAELLGRPVPPTRDGNTVPVSLIEIEFARMGSGDN